MKISLIFAILMFCFGVSVTGIAQDFSYASMQAAGNEPNYMFSGYPLYYPPLYWNYPYVPAKCEVQAAKERLWANTYLNPYSVKWQVQAAKERLSVVKYSCPTCWHEQDLRWVDGKDRWMSKIARMRAEGMERNRVSENDPKDMDVPTAWDIKRELGE